MTYVIPSAGPGWLAGAALALGASLLALLWWVRSRRRLPLPLAAAVALALLVSFEAVLLDGLSLFNAVTRPALLAGHGLLLLGTLAVAWPSLAPALARLSGWRPRWHHLRLLPLLPLVALAAVSAVRYAPNNWDSMTYHLARVAHWMQNRSVAPYPTSDFRQIFLTPGAEYLLLSLQVISGSDRLANLVQLGCYLLVAGAAPALARLAGAPAGLARWAWLLPAAAPMALLQASSTQNDLVAAVMAIAVAVSCLPYLHRRARPRGSPVDALLLAGAISGAALVKATALMAAAPFLAAAAVGLALGRPRNGRAPALLLAALTVAAVLGPELSRRLGHPPPARVVGLFSYPLWGEWGDRGLNLARGVWRHLPTPRAMVAWLSPFPQRGCAATDTLCKLALRPHEDYAGNPLQAILVLISLVAASVRWRRIPRRGRLAMTGVAAAYALLQLTLRDNEWISRLQLPLFGLSPVFLAAWSGPDRRWGSRRWIRPALGAVGLALFWHGYAAARDNEARLPLWPRAIAYRPSYYNSRWSARSGQDRALDQLQGAGCRRLGLFLGSDSYDYPLTWRAMQMGVEVRHVTVADAWPCAIFSDRGAPPAAPGVSWSLAEARPSAVAGEPAGLYRRESD